MVMDTWPVSDYDPMTLNRYAYTQNDPINNVDPSGHFLVALNAGTTMRGVLATTAIQVPRLGFSFLTNAAGNIVGIAATTCTAEYIAVHFGLIEPLATFSGACNGGGHRGRWQAQGGGIDIGVGWNQSHPLTLSEGLMKLEELKAKLSPKDRRIRADSFEMAEAFARKAASGFGITVTGLKFERNFPPGREVRVDLEIRKGTAFVLD